MKAGRVAGGRGGCSRFFALAGLLAGLCGGASARGGPPARGAAILAGGGAGAWLAVDSGGAWVREPFGFEEGTPPEVSEVRWTEAPERVELSSVAPWNVRRPWPVKAWRREGRDVVLELAEPLSTSMDCSLTYRIGGIWCEKERDGGGRERLRVENAAGRAYPGARVAVVDAGEPRPAPKLKGRPDVNPAVALSSLWMAPEPEQRPAKGMDGGDVWSVDVPAAGVAWSGWREAEPEEGAP